MKEALKLALDLAIIHHSDDGYAELRSKVRQLAKEALAQDEQSSSQEPWCMKMNGCKTKCEDCPDEAAKPQPEQEPVATVTSESGNPDVKMSWWHEPALTVGTKLYTTPPKEQRSCDKRPWGKPWVSLTDEEIWKFWWSRPEVLDGEDDGMEAEFVAAVRRVLAAHGIKENT